MGNETIVDCKYLPISEVDENFDEMEVELIGTLFEEMKIW
jgi:hypothetical protein